MTGWSEQRLDELGTLERGRSRHRPRNDPSLYGSAMPFFQTGDVKAAVLHMESPQQWYSEGGVAQSRVWEPGITCITIAANIADTAVLGVRGCFPDSVLGFTPNSQSEDAYFVKYLLDAHRDRLGSAARGTTQDNLSLEKLLSFRFPIPPAAERLVIASTLRSLDELIENNRRRVGVLEEMARAIYREWFVNFRYPGHKDVPLVDSTLGPIPAGWVAGELGDLADEVRDSTQPGNHTRSLRYVPIDEIDPRSLTLNRSRPGEEAASSLRLFKKGDILFGAMRAYFHKVCIAPVDGVTRSTCFVLRGKPEWGALPVFVLDDDETVAYASNHSSGSTIPYAKWDGVLSARKIALPPTALAADFSTSVEPMLEQARVLSRQSAELAAMRDLLLPKLVTGQVDVSALDLGPLLESSVA